MGGALKRRKYDENYEVKAYEKFCKKLKFIEGKEITVKVNEKFAAKYYANFTVPPEYQGSFPVVKTNDDEIILIESKSFYPYPAGYCGGDDVMVYVFKAKKKGKFIINFSDAKVNVTAI